MCKIHGPLGSRSLLSISSLDWTLLGCRPSPSCLAYVLFFSMFVGFLASDPACHYIAPAISLPLFYFIVTYRLTGWVSMAKIPAIPAHFPHPYLFWVLLDHIPAVPAHFILPQLSYFFFTSFTPMDFC